MVNIPLLLVVLTGAGHSSPPVVACALKQYQTELHLGSHGHTSMGHEISMAPSQALQPMDTPPLRSGAFSAELRRWTL